MARFDRTHAVIRNTPLKLNTLLTSSIDAYKKVFKEKGIDIVVDWGAHAYLVQETIYSVIDSQLRNMSGQVVATKMRELSAHNQTPLIAMVADNQGTETELNPVGGFSDQLQKPITGNLLFQLAEGHCKMTKTIDSFIQ